MMKIVTGVARSGTSFICAYLDKIGCDFGPAENLMAPNALSPVFGFFEHKEINRLNHHIMFGPRSNPQPYITMDWLHSKKVRAEVTFDMLRVPFLISAQQIKRRSHELHADIKRAANRTDFNTVKDPRFCFNLSAWWDTGAVENVLFCLRNPADVAASFNRLTALPKSVGFWVWQVWTHRFFAQNHTGSVIIVDYDALMAKDTRPAQLKKLHAFAGHPYDPEEAQRLFLEIALLRDKTSFRTPAYALRTYTRIRDAAALNQLPPFG